MQNLHDGAFVVLLLYEILDDSVLRDLFKASNPILVMTPGTPRRTKNDKVSILGNEKQHPPWKNAEKIEA